jgi:alpha-1,6-mannosyltransferase
VSSRPAAVLADPLRAVRPAALSTRARAAIGYGAIGGLLLAGLVVAVGSASSPSTEVPVSYLGFPGWLAGPLPDLDFRLGPPRFVPLIVIMALCHGAALAVSGALRVRWVLAAVVFAHLTFTLAPPILSPDVFGYLAYARMGALHGLNPYVHLPLAIPGDDVYNYVRWYDQIDPYGPLFTLASYPVAFLGLAGGLWTMKAAIGLASLGVVALVWWCARRLGTAPLAPTLFVGLNPFLLAYGVGGAHNDLLMMLLAMGAVALVLAGREASGGAMVVGAAAVKALSAGLLMPFMVLGARDRLRALLGVAAGACLIGGISLLAFGHGLRGLLGAWAMQSEKVSTHNFPNAIGWYLGLGGVSTEVRVAAGAALVLSILALLWVTWTRRLDWVTAMAWATLALLVTTTWLMHWYLVWLLPLAAIGRSSAVRWAALLLPLAMVVLGLPPVPK